MASSGAQQPLVPFVTAECFQGICTRDCPQFCYLFPPPPPLGFGPDDSSGPNLSPLVIALIGILASAFLLVSYYVLISRYCGGSLDSLRRRLTHDGAAAADESGGLRGDAWQTPPPSATGGLEEWVIRSIAVCRYKRGDGLVESTDCSVCLGEFRDGESLRLLPDCCHAFHVSCIDTWLKTHSNCPLCRANIVYTFTTPSPSPPRPPPPPPVAAAPPPQSSSAVPEIRHDSATAQDAGRGSEREERSGVDSGGAPVRKEDPLRRRGVIEQTEEGIQPNRLPREGDFPPPPNDGTVEDVGSSRGLRAEQHACKVNSGNRVLHCVVANPLPAKGSVAGSGRFCFAGQGKGSHGSLLPL